VLECLRSGKIAETCRKYEIALNLYYRWKDEVEEGAKAALGGGEAQPRAMTRNTCAGSSSWGTGSFWELLLLLD
jgi:transposase-like protein